MASDAAPSFSSTPEARFRQTWQAFEQDWTVAEASLRNLYHPDVQFTDPLVNLRGRDRFIRLNGFMHRGARSIESRLHKLVQDKDTLFASWTLVIRPKIGPTLNIEGCSYARWSNEQIVEQRDYWDVVGSLAASIPGLAQAGRLVRERFLAA